jgi:hypothetical protein
MEPIAPTSRGYRLWLPARAIGKKCPVIRIAINRDGNHEEMQSVFR